MIFFSLLFKEEDFVQDLHTVGRESENQLIREKVSSNNPERSKAKS